MESTEILVHEHDIIKRAINLLESANSRLKAGDDAIASVYPISLGILKPPGQGRGCTSMGSQRS